MMAKENEDDMSMEEILASIRQYVSTTTDKRTDKAPESLQSKVVCLTKDMLDDNQQEEMTQEASFKAEPVAQPVANKVSVKEALHKLQELKKTKPVGKTDPSISEFLSQVAEPLIRQWIEAHLKELVEKIVREEISKIIDET